ncbi:hypothetical protein RIMD111065_27080 [Aeromonas hydrophila]|nr:hypothetical protein RIMD111065_27080 [Aeromonas hydrophila]
MSYGVCSTRAEAQLAAGLDVNDVELGHQIGRFKARRLMNEVELEFKQPGSHAYKVVHAERPDIPDMLATLQPNQV